MSYQQKAIAASFVSFTVILGFYLLRVSQLIQAGDFTTTSMFRLWGITIALSIVVTILATILTFIGASVVQAIQTNGDTEIEDMVDERDKLFDLKGTRITYAVFSVGVLISMLTYVLGQPPLVMFSLLILSGLVGQITGDITRLYFYRRGF